MTPWMHSRKARLLHSTTMDPSNDVSPPDGTDGGHVLHVPTLGAVDTKAGTGFLEDVVLPWTKREDVALTHAVANVLPWDKIPPVLRRKGILRTADECAKRWAVLVKKNWTADEEKRLRELRSKYRKGSNVKWVDLTLEMAERGFYRRPKMYKELYSRLLGRSISLNEKKGSEKRDKARDALNSLPEEGNAQATFAARGATRDGPGQNADSSAAKRDKGVEPDQIADGGSKSNVINERKKAQKQANTLRAPIETDSTENAAAKAESNSRTEHAYDVASKGDGGSEESARDITKSRPNNDSDPAANERLKDWNAYVNKTKGRNAWTKEYSAILVELVKKRHNESAYWDDVARWLAEKGLERTGDSCRQRYRRMVAQGQAPFIEEPPMKRRSAKARVSTEKPDADQGARKKVNMEGKEKRNSAGRDPKAKKRQSSGEQAVKANKRNQKEHSSPGTLHGSDADAGAEIIPTAKVTGQGAPKKQRSRNVTPNSCSTSKRLASKASKNGDDVNHNENEKEPTGSENIRKAQPLKRTQNDNHGNLGEKGNDDPLKKPEHEATKPGVVATNVDNTPFRTSSEKMPANIPRTSQNKNRAIEERRDETKHARLSNKKKLSTTSLGPSKNTVEEQDTVAPQAEPEGKSDDTRETALAPRPIHGTRRERSFHGKDSPRRDTTVWSRTEHKLSERHLEREIPLRERVRRNTQKSGINEEQPACFSPATSRPAEKRTAENSDVGRSLQKRRRSLPSPSSTGQERRPSTSYKFAQTCNTDATDSMALSEEKTNADSTSARTEDRSDSLHATKRRISAQPESPHLPQVQAGQALTGGNRTAHVSNNKRITTAPPPRPNDASYLRSTDFHRAGYVVPSKLNSAHEAPMVYRGPPKRQRLPVAVPRHDIQAIATEPNKEEEPQDSPGRKRSSTQWQHDSDLDRSDTVPSRISRDLMLDMQRSYSGSTRRYQRLPQRMPAPEVIDLVDDEEDDDIGVGGPPQDHAEEVIEIDSNDDFMDISDYSDHDDDLFDDLPLYGSPPTQGRVYAGRVYPSSSLNRPPLSAQPTEPRAQPRLPLRDQSLISSGPGIRTADLHGSASNRIRRISNCPTRAHSQIPTSQTPHNALLDQRLQDTVPSNGSSLSYQSLPSYQRLPQQTRLNQHSHHVGESGLEHLSPPQISYDPEVIARATKLRRWMTEGYSKSRPAASSIVSVKANPDTRLVKLLDQCPKTRPMERASDMDKGYHRFPDLLEERTDVVGWIRAEDGALLDICVSRPNSSWLEVAALLKGRGYNRSCYAVQARHEALQKLCAMKMPDGRLPNFRNPPPRARRGPGRPRKVAPSQIPRPVSCNSLAPQTMDQTHLSGGQRSINPAMGREVVLVASRESPLYPARPRAPGDIAPRGQREPGYSGEAPRYQARSHAVEPNRLPRPSSQKQTGLQSGVQIQSERQAQLNSADGQAAALVQLPEEPQLQPERQEAIHGVPLPQTADEPSAVVAEKASAIGTEHEPQDPVERGSCAGTETGSRIASGKEHETGEGQGSRKTTEQDQQDARDDGSASEGEGSEAADDIGSSGETEERRADGTEQGSGARSQAAEEEGGPGEAGEEAKSDSEDDTATGARVAPKARRGRPRGRPRLRPRGDRETRASARSEDTGATEGGPRGRGRPRGRPRGRSRKAAGQTRWTVRKKRREYARWTATEDRTVLKGATQVEQGVKNWGKVVTDLEELGYNRSAEECRIRAQALEDRRGDGEDGKYDELSNDGDSDISNASGGGELGEIG